MDPDVLWKIVSPCFDTNDGSLPDVEIGPLTADGVARVYAMLRDRSEMTTDSAEFWCRERVASLPVDSVPNAAELVASGTAEAFHHCIDGITINGTMLPTLGVFVYQDGIALDYRMGPDWGPREVAAFFHLLLRCCDLDSNVEISPAATEGPPHPERFIKGWETFRMRRDDSAGEH